MRLVAVERAGAGAAHQTRLGDVEQLEGDLLKAAPADLGLEPDGRRVDAQPVAVLRSPVAGDRPGGGEGVGVVDQPDPEGWQRAEPAPGAAIGPAHLDELLDARFGKDRRQMIRPVGQERPLARQGGQAAVEEVAEALAQGIDIGPVSIDEVHRHVERVIDPALEAEAFLEDEGQHPRAIRIEVTPDAGAMGQDAGRPALEEGGVGEERRRHRLQRERDAQLGDHVRLGGEVEIHLNRAGAVHHLGAVGADAAHVVGHETVAALGHHRHLVVRPFRRGAEADETRPDRVGHLAHLAQMLVHLVAGLVDGLERGAGELELAAGLEADIRPVLDETDQVARLLDRLPAEALGQPGEHGADRAGPVIGQRRMGLEIVAELLVLCPDAPVLGWLAARLKITHQFGPALDRAAPRLRYRHGPAPSQRPGMRAG